PQRRPATADLPPGGHILPGSRVLLRGVPGGGRLRAVLLECDVEVAAAEAETGHAGPARVFGAVRPGPRLGVDVQRAAVQLELRVRRFDLDGRRQDLVVQGERGLEQPCRAGRGLGVADLRLDRADGAPGHAGTAAVAVLAAAVTAAAVAVEYLAQRCQLGQI